MVASLPNTLPSSARQNLNERMSSDVMLTEVNIPPAVSITTTMTMKTTILPTTAVNSVESSESPNANSNRHSAVPIPTVHIVRRAKFSPPPPPPRRLLLTQSNLKTLQPQETQSTNTTTSISTDQVKYFRVRYEILLINSGS